MPWGAAIGAVAGIAGSALSSGAQSSAAEQAAADQENASLAQLGLSSEVFNAQSAMQQPTREVGGLASSREAYLLGLTPNLDISQDFETPQVNFNPSAVGGSSNPASLSYVGPNGQPISSGYGMTATANPVAGGGAMGPGQISFGGMTYGGTASPYYTPNGVAPTTIPGSQAGMASAVAGPGAAATGAAGPNAIPNPNASLPAGSYGSFASPYNPSTFYQDPGYQFIQQQGQQAIQNQQATTGMALSPAALSAGLSYTTGLASQEFNNAYNRSMNTQTTQLNELNALSSGGQIATSGVSSAASGLGAAGSSALAGYGNAGAAGAIGVGNAVSSGINGVTNSIAGYNASTALNGGETPLAQYQANNMLPTTNSQIANDSSVQALQNPSFDD
jgi:hypothetical protein